MRTALKLLARLALTLALISAVVGLNCITCSDPSDPDCASSSSAHCTVGESSCMSIRLREASGIIRIMKRCDTLELCRDNGRQNFSLNVNFGNILGSAECCDTSDCNSATVPTLPTPGPSSVQCPSCNPDNHTQCDVQLTCNSLEPYCFTSKMSIPGEAVPVPANGCSSEEPCFQFFDMLNSIGTIVGQQSCVEPPPPPTAAPTPTSSGRSLHTGLPLSMLTLLLLATTQIFLDE